MKLLALSLLLSLPTLAAADPTKTITTRDGKCTVTVPAAWTSDTSIATSPDKKRSITVSAPKAFDSFDELKKTAPTANKDSKVTKHTETEFEMEGKSITGKPDVYRAIPGTGKGFCIAELIYENGTVDEARAIIRTLAPAK